ncbi:MAG TPA: 3-hydroxyacyl-CoA dehydrogenase NAD-binding domain-containing protein, partial [Polyangium sp.]|nr:3-hydroxyacyl-CoA dehydrogenase NAD-binding domain-containing protein [Polyangium sp.]
MNASSVKRMGVLGAGQMGRGIAQVAAAAGVEVVLCDASLELAEKGKAQIAAILGKQAEKGKISQDEVNAQVGRITPAGAIADFSSVDIAVEAATENVDLKLQLFRAADAALPKDAILASNTSSISITRLAAATSRPSRVIGMHFMNPVPLMKLVEIVRGVQTDPSTFETVRELSVRFGKTVIVSEDRPGFLV